LNNKLNIFILIKNHTQEIFNFIKTNSTRVSVINNKLKLIIQNIKNIADYDSKERIIPLVKKKKMNV
jgi:hypothetical protein